MRRGPDRKVCRVGRVDSALHRFVNCLLTTSRFKQFVSEVHFDVRMQEVERNMNLRVGERGKQFAHGECIALHLKFVIFSGRRNCARLLTIFKVERELLVFRRYARRRLFQRGRRFFGLDMMRFEIDDLDLQSIIRCARDQKLVDNTEKNSEWTSQTKPNLAPQTWLTAGWWRIV